MNREKERCSVKNLVFFFLFGFNFHKIMLTNLAMMSIKAKTSRKAMIKTSKTARAMMLGGMWDSDVQSDWRDSCDGFCGNSRPSII